MQLFFVCPCLFVFGFLYTSCILFFLIQLLLPIEKKSYSYSSMSINFQSNAEVV